jgi:hypothetical protein
VQIDTGPDTQAIFDGEDRSRAVLEQLECQRKMFPDRLDGFEDDAGDLDDDQKRQGRIDSRGIRLRGSSSSKDRRKLPAQIAVARFGHVSRAPMNFL